MSDQPYVVQKVEWYQFRDADGMAFMVMVSSLPNGDYTAVPCQVSMVLADHALMALATSPDDALAQLQKTLAGRSQQDIFPASY